VHTFLDLGMAPVDGRAVPSHRAHVAEPFVALHLRVCDGCWLVQWDGAGPADRTSVDLDADSDPGPSDAGRTTAARMVERFRLGPGHRVVEVAAPGHGLRHHFGTRGIATIGARPDDLARLVGEGLRADLLVADPVLVRAVDLAGALSALKGLLARGGVLTAEVPYLGALLQEHRCDGVTRADRSWFTLLAAEHALARAGLKVFDVEDGTAPGWLRVHAGHAGEVGPAVTERMQQLRDREQGAGYDRLETYLRVAGRVVAAKHRLLRFLLDARAAAKRVVGYGDAPSGDALLTYCGIRTDFLEYTCGRPGSTGRLLPGTRIPIAPPGALEETRPDYVLVLPGRPPEEVVAELACVRGWGGRVVLPVPELEVL
jgi:hypothetical protein